ncbi:MAG: hypothetical protein GTN62_07305 [Gemmatimonadales bacterium]|nr:hypothetical protein [Gemmatimonadales bacterium]NIN11307.1 hypothetical protein [Gemmatimonadales bacterium]NIN49906.1 hypothetical protein [Gemmatimonadales bacterium]NIP07370.1 hypothetical protein [Gemmatimonadales bacterium]NIR03065.1 hypothetical protein [Gemmatimonadales bacterium]
MPRLRVGALDPLACAGLVVCDQPNRGFAIRFAVERDGDRADGEDLLYLAHEVGPHAPDGSYARIAFDTSLPFGLGGDTPVVARHQREPGLTLEWSRLDDGAVLRASVAFGGTLELRAYHPWDWAGSWEAEPAGLKGVTADGGLHCVVATTPGGRIQVEASGEATLRFAVESGDQILVRVVVAPSSVLCRHLPPSAADVDATLRTAADRYQSTRVTVDGHWSNLAAAVTNNLHWTVALQPERGRLYAPAGRRWLFPRKGGGREHWTLFCWDSFFSVLELALESPELARDALAAVLETQYENGNIPNWRGRFAGTPDRSQPPIGSWVVLRSYLRTGERKLLELAFPYLERWSAWWRAPKGRHLRRDGNGDGLYQWGADLDLVIDSPAPWENESSHHQKAAWESGQDDLPNWDEADWVEQSQTFDLGAVDLNSYLALDDECLALIASELGHDDKAVRYHSRREAHAKLVNECLWDDTRRLYADRFWNGRLSPRLAASNFLPLLAGIPSADQAHRMLEVLRDPSKFWGEYVLPTISRDDPAFQDQQYWRGAIWPPMNYLVYHGLRRYGLDDAASELAARSAELFLRHWRDYQVSPENYDCRTGQSGGTRHQSWGPLLALMGVEEFIDITPWEGLRIGTLTPPSSSAVHRIKLVCREWSVALSPHMLRVETGGRVLLRSRDPVVLRHVQVENRMFAAEVTAPKPVVLALDVGAAELRVELDGVTHVTPAEAVRVAPGRHRITAGPAEARA